MRSRDEISLLYPHATLCVCVCVCVRVCVHVRVRVQHYYHKYTADKARYDREMEAYAAKKLLSATQDADAG